MEAKNSCSPPLPHYQSVASVGNSIYVAQSEQKIRPVRRPLAGGGGQDFEKLDQNLKFPQIVKKGEKRGNFT